MEFQIFDDVSHKKVNEFLEKVSLQKRVYDKGECILQSGSITDRIHMIVSGSVEVVHYDLWGNKLIIGKFPKGNIFAESYALNEGIEIEVDVCALEKTEIYSFSTANVVDVCFNIGCPKLIYNLLKAVSEKNIHLAKRLQLVTQKGVKSRVLLYLSDYAKSVGKTSFTIPLNRQQLADYLSVDRSGLSVVLTQLKDEGVIDFEKNYFSLKIR